jgi:hypothetical protein
LVWKTKIHPEIEPFVGTDARYEVDSKEISLQAARPDIEVSFKGHHVPTPETLCQNCPRRSKTDPHVLSLGLHVSLLWPQLNSVLVLQGFGRSHAIKREHLHIPIDWLLNRSEAFMVVASLIQTPIMGATNIIIRVITTVPANPPATVLPKLGFI